MHHKARSGSADGPDERPLSPVALSGTPQPDERQGNTIDVVYIIYDSETRTGASFAGIFWPQIYPVINSKWSLPYLLDPETEGEDYGAKRKRGVFQIVRATADDWAACQNPEPF